MVAVAVPARTRTLKVQPDAPPQSDTIQGLDQAVVQARLKEEGFNELPRLDRRTPLGIIIEVIRGYG